MKRIHKVAVLGAGTMGARIAAHFANAGVPSLLLDIVPPDADGPARNKIAAAGLDGARKSKPAAFFEASLSRLVTVGNFDDDLKRLAEVDWIIEAIVENLEIKRSLLKKVEAVRKPGTIVTTNTSGLPVAKIAEGFSEDFRRSWFGTHFFNPPRYMRLLELIPTPDADPALIDAVTHFCDAQLGKGVVRAKDTPNFIGNRIGTFSVLNVMRLMQEMDLTIEEIDALTGQAVGWPRSATFRTIDLVGLDVLGHVVTNMTQNVHDERSELQIPAFFRQMVERKWLGDKTRGGFYKKKKSAVGKEDERLALDWKTLEYHPRQKPKFPALPPSTWRKTSRSQQREFACCSASTATEARHKSPTRQAHSYGRRSLTCGRIPPTAFPKSPTPWSRLMAPCARASVGNSAPSNSGTPPAWKRP